MENGNINQIVLEYGQGLSFCVAKSIYSLDIVQDRLMLLRIISDADKYSFEWVSLRCTSLDKSFIHSPLAAFNSLHHKYTTIRSIMIF